MEWRSPSSQPISRANWWPVHPAYDEAFDAFAPQAVHGNPKARQKWAVDQLMLGAKASQNLGLSSHVTFSGALAWPFTYPWPQRPEGFIDTAFGELAKRWKPILDAYDNAGVDVCFEIHPGEDLFDGATFEMFLEKVKNHRALLHQLRSFAFPAACSWTILPSSTSIMRGSRPFT